VRRSAIIILMAIQCFSSTAAIAASLTVSGVETLQYRWDDNHINPADSGAGFINTMVVNFKVYANKHVAFYSRLGTQVLSHAGFGGDFIDYRTGRRGIGQMDQFGIIYSDGRAVYTFGRQSIAVGFSGLLYDNTDAIGRHSFVDGVSMQTTKGKYKIKAIIAREDNASSLDNRIYAVSCLQQRTPRLTLGFTLAKYDFADATPDTAHYALFIAYRMNKLLLYAEHAQTPSLISMTAHNLGAAYQLDAKNYIYIITHKTEPNADINHKTAFEHDQKGYHYGMEHKFTNNTQISVLYKDNYRYASTTKYRSVQIKLKQYF